MNPTPLLAIVAAWRRRPTNSRPSARCWRACTRRGHVSCIQHQPLRAGLEAASIARVVAPYRDALPTTPIGAAFGVEWLLSFALMFVMMAVPTDERVANGFAALAVGLTVGFCALMGGPLMVPA